MIISLCIQLLLLALGRIYLQHRFLDRHYATHTSADCVPLILQTDEFEFIIVKIADIFLFPADTLAVDYTLILLHGYSQDYSEFQSCLYDLSVK